MVESNLTPEQIAANEAKAKEVKLVPESDLLAVKSAKEGLEKRLSESEATFKTQLGDVQNKSFLAEAKVKTLEEKLALAITPEEHSKVKQQLEAAQKSSGELTTKALEYRRRIVAMTYQIPVDTVKDKTLEQLDSYEEALKAVTAARGTGNYAVGGTGGGTAKVETPHERALRTILEAEEKRGYGMKVKVAEK